MTSSIAPFWGRVMMSSGRTHATSPDGMWASPTRARTFQRDYQCVAGEQSRNTRGALRLEMPQVEIGIVRQQARRTVCVRTKRQIIGGGKGDRCRLRQMQFAGAAIIIQAIGDIVILLHLNQGYAGADRMDGPRRYCTNIAQPLPCARPFYPQ